MSENHILEKTLWTAADKLRNNMDAAEYKYMVLGLIFPKYISDAFDDLYQKLIAEQKKTGVDPEDKDEYTAEHVFYVPPSARWKWLQGRAKLPLGDSGAARNRNHKILFIDAREIGTMKSRKQKELTDTDIAHIAGAYHNWRSKDWKTKYKDVPGFCKSGNIEEVRKNNYILTPGRYIDFKEVEDDGEAFEDKMKTLVVTLKEQMEKAGELDKAIKQNLEKIGYGF